MTQVFDLDTLQDRAAALVEAAVEAGADAGDAVVSASRSTGVQVRDGRVEDTESAENAGFTLRVFVGDRSASINANRPDDIAALAERAVSMARVSPPDRFAGLAPSERLATEFRDLDLFDGTEPTHDDMREAALACEAAALDIDGVAKSSGASYGYGQGGAVLVTSEGFSGAYRTSRFSLSVSAVAGEGTAMQRDYDFDSQRHGEDLRDPASIGRSGWRANRRQTEPAPGGNAIRAGHPRAPHRPRFRRPHHGCCQRGDDRPGHVLPARSVGRDDHAGNDHHHRRSVRHPWPVQPPVRWGRGGGRRLRSGRQGHLENLGSGQRHGARTGHGNQRTRHPRRVRHQPVLHQPDPASRGSLARRT